MEFSSFLSIFKKLKKYKIEVFLLTSALIIVFISIILYLKTNKKIDEEEVIIDNKKERVFSQKIFVDISGAVVKPDVYQVTAGARLKDVLTLAGGLSAEADQAFFSRNYNLAKIVSDQEKIYIPTTWEINAGLFTENIRRLDYTTPTEASQSNEKTISSSSPNETRININIASIEELDTLPGIGKVTATKIIQNRPYSSVEELLTRKIVKKSVYEKIKEMITTDY